MKDNRLALYFTKDELKNSKLRKIINELINEKLDMQKYNDFIKISPMELEFIKLAFRGEFVEKAKYHNMTTFKNEIGKIRGKKLILEE